jgi:hypothetical protein
VGCGGGNTPRRGRSAQHLRDQTDNYLGENFKGFAITTFDGNSVIVRPLPADASASQVNRVTD